MPTAQENPLLEGLQLRRTPDPCAIVIFGASGDLTQKKLFPALYSLAFRRLLPAGFAVVGVSLDGDGWKVLKPFLDEHKVPYAMLLGDDPMAQRYGIKNLPDTFLIDRQGRIASVYREGLVDRDNVEANIKALLSDH